METTADVVPLAAWAFGDEPVRTKEAVSALETAPARPVLVRLVAELARIVLLDEPTATHILQHLRSHFEDEQGLTAAEVEAPVRAALTGRHVGPPLAPVMALLGRERCMRRIAAALR